jgi:hypothetical protein
MLHFLRLSYVNSVKCNKNSRVASNMNFVSKFEIILMMEEEKVSETLDFDFKLMQLVI